MTLLSKFVLHLIWWSSLPRMHEFGLHGGALLHGIESIWPHIPHAVVAEHIVANLAAPHLEASLLARGRQELAAEKRGAPEIVLEAEPISLAWRDAVSPKVVVPRLAVHGDRPADRHLVDDVHGIGRCSCAIQHEQQHYESDHQIVDEYCCRGHPQKTGHDVCTHITRHINDHAFPSPR